VSAPTIPARPTVYRGIQMRSRLEAKAAAELDKHGLSWRYEPWAFGDAEGQYLPDFAVATSKPSVVGKACDKCRAFDIRYWVEVKPRSVMADALALMRARTRLLIVRSSVPNARLCLWFPDADSVLYSPRPDVWRAAPASYALRDMAMYARVVRSCANREGSQ